MAEEKLFRHVHEQTWGIAFVGDEKGQTRSARGSHIRGPVEKRRDD